MSIERRLRLGIAALPIFTALPFVRLIAENPGYPVSLSRLFLYWSFTSAVVIGVVLLVRTFAIESAARLAGVLALTIYAFGTLSIGMRNALDLQRVLGVDGAVWITLAVVAGATLITRWDWAELYAFMLGAFLLVTSVAPILTQIGGAETLSSLPTNSERWELTARSTPDVYWFVLDGYGRDDVLAKVYEFEDQEHFLHELEVRGFTVSPQAIAPYPLTILSMASTLSGSYVAAEGDEVQEAPLHRAIQGDNRSVATFRSWGYEYVHVPGDTWSGSACSWRVDRCIILGSSIAETERILLSMTPAASLVATRDDARVHAERSDPIATVRAIAAAEPTSPFFALIHLINPHPPYYNTGENCAFRDVPFSLRTAFGDKEYVEAIKCLNRQLLSAVDLIQSRDKDAVIILQGDHGPIRNLSVHDADLDTWTRDDIWIRFGVLGAMRLPEGCHAPGETSLVNTFRIVFGCLAGEPLTLLPTRTWLANIKPGEIEEIVPPARRSHP